MKLTFLTAEMHEPRWALDMIVCSVAASGFYLCLVWWSRGFEISPREPRELLGSILVLVLGYALSAFAGYVFVNMKLPSFMWVSIAGSGIFILVGIVNKLPSYIDYYYRFTPEPVLATYLINSFALTLFVGTLSFAVVALIAVLLARILTLLIRTLVKGRQPQ